MANLQDFIRVNSDSNGNPRYVCHFLTFITDAENARSGAAHIDVSVKYDMALIRAHSIGGRKFHNRQFGGGIVFKCYGESDLAPRIDAAMSVASHDESHAYDLSLSVLNDGATYADRKRYFAMAKRDSFRMRKYALMQYEEMARIESRRPHNKGRKYSRCALIVAAHNIFEYMARHYVECDNGADWLQNAGA